MSEEKAKQTEAEKMTNRVKGGLTESGGWHRHKASEHSPPNELLEPYRYVSALEGKGVRKMFMNAFNHWLEIDPEINEVVAEMIGVLHTSSLIQSFSQPPSLTLWLTMIDDIEDDSKLRRGIPVTHHIYGVPSTINTANYMYFLAMQKIHNFGGAEATQIFLDELLNLHRGQGYDILWRDSNRCPSEEEYKEMVADKTGGLFRLSLRLMQVFSENKTDYLPLVNLLGLYYQIRDDYLNLQSEEYQKNKSFAEDLTEGKFSFPIIHAIHHDTKDHRLLNILKKRTEDIDVKLHAVKYMRQCGSFTYTLEVLKVLMVEIKEMIASLGGNSHLDKILDYLEHLKY